MLEGALDFGFSDVGSQVLDVKVGFVAGLRVESLEFSGSLSTALMPVGVEVVFSSFEGSGVVGDVGDGLLGTFFILEADESRIFLLSVSGLLLDELGLDFSVFGEDFVDQSVDFGFGLANGEVLNVDISFSGGGASSVLGNKREELELGFFEFTSLEQVYGVVGVFLLLELDVTVSERLSLRVGGDLGAEDGSDLGEEVVEILDSDVGADVLDIDVGFRDKVSDVSLEHYSDIFAAELLVLSVLTGGFS